MRDDWRFLQYAFRAKDLTSLEREEIAEKHGIWWSQLNVLPEWMPGTSSPLEFMHSTFLGASFALTAQ